ncbi:MULTISPECIES: AMP-binding protein [Flavobacteriaceae]|uniref:AMP-dependent synthetase n=2 Tax=Flavobacteriaceae TaxID=49546 RepID=A0A4Y8ARJ2_9FLAO|nr:MULTISPECIES: AMP-binding protein [Flavobacteriaceae]TEW73774.1 AMP-dependent synthetase [Gramella jeungdoensis]GGK37422.1 AMP-dependent synthetase [Lutibacter litoralis]
MDKTVWKPSKRIIESSNIYKMMQHYGFDEYKDFWKWSVANKETFWEATVKNLEIKLAQNYTSIVDTSKGVENAAWLKNSKLNIVDSCFQNEDNETAVIFQEEGKSLQKITQKELLKLVNQIANGLQDLGLKEGDKIAINMPMTLEAVAIYLAGIKAGMPIVTIADSFTPNEIEIRLNITKPKVIFTQDVLKRGEKELPLYQKVVDANAPKTIVIKTSKEKFDLRKEDVFLDTFLSSKTDFNTVIQNPEAIITVLFSSGTTGAPKAIPWTHTTPIKSASDGYYHQDIHKNDVVCWPTNLGWMMGPWLVFASLINKASIALYYGTPTDANFGQFVQDAKVTMLGVIPSFVKYWQSSKCMEQFNWNAIQCYSSTGEVSNPLEMNYLMQLANNKPVIEYCGGTEIGGGYITSTVVQPNIASTFSSQALGGEFILLDETNNKTKKGELFLIPPIMGLSNTLLNSNHYDVYYKNTPKYEGKLLRRHGDQLEQLENGYYKMQGRVDDAMNLGGIKVSSIQIEAVINKLSFVKESAAIAVAPKEGGPSVLVVYYVENSSKINVEERFQQAKDSIKNKLNPLFKLTDLIKIEILPRTASNKVMRRKLREEYLK